MSTTVTTARLALVVLTRAYLRRWLEREPVPELGFTDPDDFLGGAEDVVRLRLAQLADDPTIAAWLLRAIVVRDTRVAVGFINFHAAPDADGRVELGYEVAPPHRRRGYAHEAAAAAIAWAGHRGARVVRACAHPDNVASLAVIARLGLAAAGEQRDADGTRELVFEAALA